MSDSSREAAQDSLEGIVSLVAAYKMDWDEYEDLKEQREASEFDYDTDEQAHQAWAALNPTDAETLADLESTSAGYADQDAARDAIEDNHYGIEVRSHWVEMGQPVERDGLAEFRIVLAGGGPAGGGPAVRIMGEFGHNGSVKRCYLQHQDCGTPWTDLIATGDEYQALMTFCQMVIPE